jgi:hypothetical protein
VELFPSGLANCLVTPPVQKNCETTETKFAHHCNERMERGEDVVGLCAVCLEAFDEDVHLPRLLTCGHSYDPFFLLLFRFIVFLFLKNNQILFLNTYLLVIIF